MTVNKSFLAISLTCVCLYQTVAIADTPALISTPHTSVKYLTSPITQADYQALTTSEQNAIASMWHLSPTDYNHYLWLMNNSPNGIYYKNKSLDPSVILGFNAKDDIERKKYALTAIKNEQARVAKELAFQNIFYHLQQTLYPTLKPIADKRQAGTANPFSLQAGDKLLFFTDITSGDSGDMVNKLIHVVLENSGIKLAIYVTSQLTTDEAIRKWAAQQAIPPNLVNTNRISLNHDQGQFQKLTEHQTALPLLLLLRDGHLQPINVTDIP